MDPRGRSAYDSTSARVLDPIGATAQIGKFTSARALDPIGATAQNGKFTSARALDPIGATAQNGKFTAPDGRLPWPVESVCPL